jgi:hypothetical protein
MSEMMQWAQPLRSPKFHVFQNGRSLCGKWLLFVEDGIPVTGKEKKNKDDCADCHRRLLKHFASK